MFTVLIADDEPRICELIRYLIRWEELGLTFLGSVHDGQALYNAIVQQRPDIVISDVVMPQMTGLEIIRRVKQDGIYCNFVIISGHRYFEYVQDAIKNGACDYLLKPINGEELNETLHKICGRMTEDLKKEQTVSSGRREMEQTRQILRRHLVTNAFSSGSELFADLESVNREYSVSFGSGWYQAITITAEGGDEDTGSLIARKGEELVTRVLQEQGGYVVSCTEAHCASFLINYRDLNGDIERQLEDAFTGILYQAGMFSNVTVTMGCGTVESSFQQFPQSIRTARLAMRDRIRLGRGKVIWVNRRGETVDEIERCLDRDHMRQLARALEGLNPNRYEEWLRDVCKKSESWSGNAWYELCEKVGLVYTQMASERRFPNCGDNLAQELTESLERAAEGRLAESLLLPVVRRMKQASSQQQEQSSKPIRLAKEYIEAHYMEQIKLEDVAGHVYLHPAYLSHIFKETLGIGFSDYLANCRLERAKYLLTHTNDTIYEIARQAGYTEPRAFSKFFLKNVGVKPTDYRRMYS